MAWMEKEGKTSRVDAGMEMSEGTGRGGERNQGGKDGRDQAKEEKRRRCDLRQANPSGRSTAAARRPF